MALPESMSEFAAACPEGFTARTHETPPVPRTHRTLPRGVPPFTAACHMRIIEGTKSPKFQGMRK